MTCDKNYPIIEETRVLLAYIIIYTKIYHNQFYILILFEATAEIAVAFFAYRLFLYMHFHIYNYLNM